MKKAIVLVLGSLLLIMSLGCEVDPYKSGELNFFTHLTSANIPVKDTSIEYRDGGYTILISRGEQGKKLSKGDAEILMQRTEFDITLDGTSLPVLKEKSVKKLGFTGYHVVKTFDLGTLKPGTYVLIGYTCNASKTGCFANTVNLTIK